MSLTGFLNVNKPPGISSRRVVDRVQRLVRPAKAGHAGTLDPLATGVLIVAVGSATRLIKYVQRRPKQYRATFLFGRRSDTEDVEGNVYELESPPRPSRAEVDAAVERFTGEIEQCPPAYSALKVAGRRAYDLARSGQTVELAPRPVVIHRLAVVEYSYPELTLDIECSSGTYVRSLGRDVAESLGTAAVMSALVRTAIGEFRLADASEPEELTRENLADLMQPSLCAVADLPRVELTEGEVDRVLSGQAIDYEVSESVCEYTAVDQQGELVAIMKPAGTAELRPSRTFRR